MTKRHRNNQRNRTRARLLAFGPACLLIGGAFSLPAGAQSTTATLGGTVLDASGAVVPGAQVTLKNESTGDIRKLISNGSGVFTFTALPVGTYDVTIVARSFQTYEQDGIHLDPGDVRTVRDTNLTAGSTETVDVTTAANTVNIDSGEQSSLISAEEIKHLSVEGRDVTELLKILPGFAISSGGAGNISNVGYDPSQVSFQGALGAYAANGTPVNGQALLSDGVDITDPGAFGGALQTVNYEQVAEVKVSTSSFTADTAHGPIVINTVSKSGGQKYHGSLYVFARTSQLNSTDWIAKNSNQAKPPDRFVYPGFTLGGPILIPGTSFNKNRKLTFFVGAEDYAQRNVYAYGSASSATLHALVPTAGMRTGDFSAAQIQQYVGSAYTIDPAGGACAGPGQDANICRVPVTAPNSAPITNGNIAPYLDPLGKIILNEMPLPNTVSNGTYNYITTNLENNDTYQVRGRVDFNPTDRTKFFAIYSYENGVQGIPQNEYYSATGAQGGIDLPGGGLNEKQLSHIASFNYTSILSNSLTNEFYAAGAYYKSGFNANNPAAVANNPYTGLFHNGSKVQPALNDYGFDGLPILRTPDTTFGPIFANKQVRIGGDNVTKVLGQHTFRAGVFYESASNPQVAPFVATNGEFSAYYFPEVEYNDPTIHTTGPVGSGSGGNYLANISEGQFFEYDEANKAPEPNLYFYNIAGYVQDHWLVNRRLTLDLGIRIEHMTPWQDSHNIGIASFNAATYDKQANYNVSANTNLPGFEWHAIDSAIPNAGRPTRAAFYSPRAGFALDLYGGGNTILRGGAGLYRAHDAYTSASNQSQTTEGLRTATVNFTRFSQLASIGPGAASFVADSSVYGFDGTDDEEPLVVTYNAAIDQRLPGKMLLEIAYVGNRSSDLLNDGSTQNTALNNINSLHIGALYGAQPNSRSDTASTAGYVAPIFPANGQAGVGNSQQIIDSFKRFPLYNHVYVPEHNTYSNYNGLQVGLTKQAGRATFNVNYTYSKALGILGIGGSATYSAPGDPFNYRNDYSNLPFDRRSIFNASYYYSFGNPVHNRYVGYLTNGWDLSGISNYQSAPNLTSIAATSNFGLSGTVTVNQGTVATYNGATSVCPTATCAVSVSNTELLGTPDVTLQSKASGFVNATHGNHQYINASALSLPNLGTNGQYSYGFLPGPGFFNTDLTAAKRFKVTEGSSIQLRVAAFNFINHANNSFTSVQQSNYTITENYSSTATNLNTALSQGNAGLSNGFGYAPLKQGRRIMELGLRYDF